MTRSQKIGGLIPAVFTPLKEDGSLNLAAVPPLVEHLINDGVDAVFVGGSTGEGISMTSGERKEIARAYTEAVDGRLPVIIQVGHNSLAEARQLAAYAQEIGADAISASPPSYFRPATLDLLLRSLAEITAGAPDLPFFYYHIPRVTGVEFSMLELLQYGESMLPTLAGIKYSVPTVYELQACVELYGDRFTMLFGSDEMLLSGLVGGAHGAVGSTYNFAAPLYNNVIAAFKAGDIEAAQRYQALSSLMVLPINNHGGQSALKPMMKLIGQDCGPNRLPLATLGDEKIAALRADLAEIGFFDWGRS